MIEPSIPMISPSSRPWNRLAWLQRASWSASSGSIRMWMRSRRPGRCKECNKPYTKLPNEAIKHFPILYQFCNGDLEKLFLLLGKGIYPYEYMDSWEKFDETSIPPKEAFYSELNEEGISDADYEHFQKVWEVFKIKTMGEYHGL